MRMSNSIAAALFGIALIGIYGKISWVDIQIQSIEQNLAMGAIDPVIALTPGSVETVHVDLRKWSHDRGEPSLSIRRLPNREKTFQSGECSLLVQELDPSSSPSLLDGTRTHTATVEIDWVLDSSVSGASICQISSAKDDVLLNIRVVQCQPSQEGANAQLFLRGWSDDDLVEAVSWFRYWGSWLTFGSFTFAVLAMAILVGAALRAAIEN